MGGNTLVDYPLGQAAIITTVAGKINFIITDSVDHESQVHIIKIAPVHKFQLASVIADYSLLAQGFTVFNLDQLLGRHKHQPDRAGQPSQDTRALQGRRHANKGRTLGMMATCMGLAIHSLFMGRAGQGIQFCQQQDFRPGLFTSDIRVKTRDIASLGQLVTQGAKNILQIGRSLPLPVASLRILPDIFLGCNYSLAGCHYCFHQHGLSMAKHCLVLLASR